jgi:hypothetical protein
MIPSENTHMKKRPMYSGRNACVVSFGRLDKILWDLLIENVEKTFPVPKSIDVLVLCIALH